MASSSGGGEVWVDVDANLLHPDLAGNIDVHLENAKAVCSQNSVEVANIP
jgi:hypothetical protein